MLCFCGCRKSAVEDEAESQIVRLIERGDAVNLEKFLEQYRRQQQLECVSANTPTHHHANGNLANSVSSLPPAKTANVFAAANTYHSQQKQQQPEQQQSQHSQNNHHRRFSHAASHFGGGSTSNTTAVISVPLLPSRQTAVSANAGSGSGNGGGGGSGGVSGPPADLSKIIVKRRHWNRQNLFSSLMLVGQQHFQHNGSAAATTFFQRCSPAIWAVDCHQWQLLPVLARHGFNLNRPQTVERWTVMCAGVENSRPNTTPYKRLWTRGQYTYQSALDYFLGSIYELLGDRTYPANSSSQAENPVAQLFHQLPRVLEQGVLDVHIIDSVIVFNAMAVSLDRFLCRHATATSATPTTNTTTTMSSAITGGAAGGGGGGSNPNSTSSATNNGGTATGTLLMLADHANHAADVAKLQQNQSHADSFYLATNNNNNNYTNNSNNNHHNHHQQHQQHQHAVAMGEIGGGSLSGVRVGVGVGAGGIAGGGHIFEVEAMEILISNGFCQFECMEFLYPCCSWYGILHSLLCHHSTEYVPVGANPPGSNLISSCLAANTANANSLLYAASPTSNSATGNGAGAGGGPGNTNTHTNTPPHNAAAAATAAFGAANLPPPAFVARAALLLINFLALKCSFPSNEDFRENLENLHLRKVYSKRYSRGRDEFNQGLLYLQQRCQQFARRPQSLRLLSRAALRRHIGGVNFVGKLTQLNLPSQMAEFVRYIRVDHLKFCGSFPDELISVSRGRRFSIQQITQIPPSIPCQQLFF